MTVKVCKCEQCRARKSAHRTKYKKRIRRYINRLRRNWKNDDEIFNWYWA